MQPAVELNHVSKSAKAVIRELLRTESERERVTLLLTSRHRRHGAHGSGSRFSTFG